MSYIRIDNVPEDVYEVLGIRAEMNERTLELEALASIERDLHVNRIDQGQTLSKLAELHAQLSLLIVDHAIVDSAKRAGRE